MTLGEWLDTPDDQEGGQSSSMTLGEWLDTPDPPELRAAPGERGLYEEPQAPEKGMIETYGPTALRMAGPVVGALAGIPGGPVGSRVGGAIGGAAGEAGARYLEGREQAILPTAVAAVGGAVVPASGLSMGEMAAREALVNAGLTGASRLADQQIPSGKELLLGGALGAAGGAAMSRLQPRAPEVPLPVRGEVELPPALQAELPPEVMGPPAPNAGPFARFEEPAPAPALPEMPYGAAGPPSSRPSVDMPVGGERILPPDVMGPPSPTARTRGAPEFTPFLEGPQGGQQASPGGLIL
jgi:hypothetical protein